MARVRPGVEELQACGAEACLLGLARAEAGLPEAERARVAALLDATTDQAVFPTGSLQYAYQRLYGDNLPYLARYTYEEDAPRRAAQRKRSLCAALLAACFMLAPVTRRRRALRAMMAPAAAAPAAAPVAAGGMPPAGVPGPAPHPENVAPPVGQAAAAQEAMAEEPLEPLWTGPAPEHAPEAEVQPLPVLHASASGEARAQSLPPPSELQRPSAAHTPVTAEGVRAWLETDLIKELLERVVDRVQARYGVVRSPRPTLPIQCLVAAETRRRGFWSAVATRVEDSRFDC